MEGRYYMNVSAGNPFSFKQIEADLYMADTAIKKADSLSSKEGKRKGDMIYTLL